MRNAIVISMSVFQLIGCAAPISKRSTAHDYSQAIDEAEVQKVDRRDDLRECVAKWVWKLPVRNTLLQDVLDSRNELKGDSILLEISSSGGIRYDYVYVENSRLRSNIYGAGEIDISGTVLKKHIDEVSEQELRKLSGRAYSNAMDAPCYFLSIKKGPSTKTVAIYGSLESSNADSLIKELLAAVGVQTPDVLLP